MSLSNFFMMRSQLAGFPNRMISPRRLLNQISAVRGMPDKFGKELEDARWIESCLRDTVQLHNYKEISTPILEHVGLFQRTLGEETDVVSKEMYILEDRNREQLALRPEATAAVMRAVTSHHELYSKMPQKLYYVGPMFRYERPQKGRLRQFDQFGVEYLGKEHPLADVECISMAFEALKKLNLHTAIELQINTIGLASERATFQSSLYTYLSHHAHQLSPISQQRLSTHQVWRILDSKMPQDQRILKDAPQLLDHLSPATRAYWDSVQRGLTAWHIPFSINPTLVRGLDYYQHTVFEFCQPPSSLVGSQSTVLAGGRYRLPCQPGLFDKEMPAVGWAAGIDRLRLSLPTDRLRGHDAQPLLRVMAFDSDDATESELQQHDAVLWDIYRVVNDARSLGFPTDIDYDHHASPERTAQGGRSQQSLTKRLQRASKDGVAAVLLLGPDERQHRQLSLKNLSTGEQCTVSSLVSARAQIMEFLGVRVHPTRPLSDASTET